MSAQMNNKYDIGNFSKLLEEYKDENEMETIERNLFPDRYENQGQGERIGKIQHKFEVAKYESKKYNINQIQND